MNDNLNTFLIRVMTLEISTISGRLDLSRYRYGSATEEDEELKRLQQDALSEILFYDSKIVQQQLDRMEKIKQRFEKFWVIWSDGATALLNGTLNEEDFIEQIKNHFLLSKFTAGRITQYFIDDLQNAIMYKEGTLLALMDQLPGHQEPDHSFISHLTLPDKDKRQPFADELKRLSLAQIALIHIYNTIDIIRDNADGIAAKSGWTSPKSGEGLYQQFTHYAKQGRRISNEGTLIKMENKRVLFESVLPYLNKDGKQRATTEITILKTLETEYIKK